MCPHPVHAPGLCYICGPTECQWITNPLPMLVKKLAVPFINNKVLHEATHCYIATAGISEAGFDFVRSRIAPKCKIDIVTGLDTLTSPNVLKRVWKHYLDRMDFRVYTKNPFHANVYIFDLPFRKAVAFSGSGTWTLEGLKDQEEVFQKTIDAKDIEELKSWFTGYFEFAEPITEELIVAYDQAYPMMKQHEIAMRKERQQFIDLSGRGFTWEGIRFRTQLFKKEDYQLFHYPQATENTDEVQAARTAVQDKLLELHGLLKDHLFRKSLLDTEDAPPLMSPLTPGAHPGQKVRSLAMAYGDAALTTFADGTVAPDRLTLQVAIQQKDIVLQLAAAAGSSQHDRVYLQKQLYDEAYRSQLLELLTALGSDYTLEVAGEQVPANAFRTADALWAFAKDDDWRYYTLSVFKTYRPGDPALGTDKIADTLSKEIDKLLPLYQHLQED